MDSSGRSTIILSILLLILLSNTVHGRKDPGEYWKEIMKGQPMPEAIKGLSGYKDGPVGENSFIKEFDPRPNISTYHDDVGPNQVTADCNTHHDGPASKKPFMDDFEPRPNISTYND